eukprot:3689105-Pyramimonas_sp.AAC.1
MEQWLLKALPRGAKRVHSWLKYDQGADLGHLVTPSEVKQLPEEMMQYRQDFWSAFWAAPWEQREALSGVLDV